jgi:1,5-anhydro-D-fructose reductase (1,5-anhydro-D-mannitol-forming)
LGDRLRLQGDDVAVDSSNEQSMIRFGILGFGLHAVRRLMPGFDSAKRCTVTGLWRRDTKKAQQAVKEYSRFNLRAFESPDALCSSPEIDAIFVASPDALHLSHVLTAIQHRKPVLCEKPMGMNSAECLQMVTAANAAGVLLGVAHNFRFNRSAHRLRELVGTGRIGKPFLVRSEFHFVTRNSPRTWINDPNLACSGPIGDVGVHCIDALRYILQDEVASVYCQALYDPSAALEYAATLLLEFHKGTIASITVSTRTEYRTPLWITGDNGFAGAEDALNVEHPIEVICKTHGENSVVQQVSNESGYSDQVDAFALSIEQGLPFPVPGTEGLRNQQVLDAAYLSIKSGRREEVKF